MPLRHIEGSTGKVPLIGLNAGEWPASCPTPQKRIPHYLFHRQLGGAQSQAGNPKEKKNFLPLPRFEPWTDKPIV